MTSPLLPRARTDQLLVVDVDGETLVYDLACHRAHCLNGVAGIVWRLCDGRTSVEGIMAGVASATGVNADEEFVWYALRRLNGARLIEGFRAVAPAHVVTRRDLLRRMTAAGFGLMLLPTVATIVAPTTLQAQVSCLPAGAPCVRGVGLPCCGVLDCKNEPGGGGIDLCR